MSIIWLSPLSVHRVAVPGLLVTGRSGAGKTALLHAVSKAMQNDSRTLTCMSHLRIESSEYGEKLNGLASRHTLRRRQPLCRLAHRQDSLAPEVLDGQGIMAQAVAARPR